MILYKNMKAMVCLPDRDTDFVDILTRFPSGDTLAPYLFILCLAYILQTSLDLIKENGFTLLKTWCRRYPAETVTDADNLALFTNIPAQFELKLHNLEQTAGDIGLSVNANRVRVLNKKGPFPFEMVSF